MRLLLNCVVFVCSHGAYIMSVLTLDVRFSQNFKQLIFILLFLNLPETKGLYLTKMPDTMLGVYSVTFCCNLLL